jgi:hypothetical protein
MTHRWTKPSWQLGAAALALFALGVLVASAGVVRAQGCTAINGLLMEGHAAPDIAQALGVTINDVEVCRQILLQQPRVVGPAGRPPLGAPGPAPQGAPGPPPLGAPGRPPVGAAGPPPMKR